jgi:LacI family transcriptional regulator
VRTATKQGVTMKDIADRAGVSRATVGFVLSGRESPVRISDDTRRRVLSAADELKYRPNGVARAMRTGRFGSVALLLSVNRSNSLVPPALLDGIHDALAENDLHLVVTKLPDEKLTSEGFVPRILRESSSDGLIINYNADIPDALVQLIRDHRVPAVWVNSRQEADCVYPDDLRAGREATTLLLERGHRRIAYLDYSSAAHYSADDRAAGYEAALREAGSEPMVCRTRDVFDRDERAAHVAALLARPDRPTAIVTYTPHMLTPLFLAARANGLSVPRDLSVVTFTDVAAQPFGLMCDAMMLPENALGRAAVAMLAEKIEDPTRVHPPVVLPLQYARAETVTAPPLL